MTDENLIELIDAFNDNKFEFFATFRRLSESVVFGYVWTHSPTGAVCNESGHRFYFILDEGRCVGIVFEMGAYDLHWLMNEDHRKKGHLYRSLHDYIFPHMFGDGRERQFASANSQVGIDYAIRQGFEELSERGSHGQIRLRLDRSQVDMSKCPPGINQPLDEDEIQELKTRLRKAKALIKSASEELLCRCGSDILGLDGLANDLEFAASDLPFVLDKVKSE